MPDSIKIGIEVFVFQFAFALACVGLFVLWEKKYLRVRSLVFTLYIVQLVLNLLWLNFAGYLNLPLGRLNANASANVDVPRTHTLPTGYTYDTFTVMESMNTKCTRDEECKTPEKYLARSGCPYSSLCLKHTCTVVCPHVAEMGE